MITGLHHAQITIPEDAEDATRDFYCRLLGLPEIPKPDSLAGRGGLWLQVGEVQVHLGTESGAAFQNRRATKAHLAYEVDDLETFETVRGALAAEGFEALTSTPIPDHDRFETRDPFGNRVELIWRLG